MNESHKLGVNRGTGGGNMTPDDLPKPRNVGVRQVNGDISSVWVFSVAEELGFDIIVN